MIDEWSPNGSGFARFSEDRAFRFRLARALTPLAIDYGDHISLGGSHLKRVVFVMLNPSTASAFKDDNTIRKCAQFAQLWGADVLEVVNLFAFRTTYPEDLHARASRAESIIGYGNDEEILAACVGAQRVVAGWGLHGALCDRGAAVRELLARSEILVERLGATGNGYPLHPLARGKYFIPLSREPELWL